MTTLLQQAFDAAANLPASEQDLLAARVLAELAAEDKFDEAITASGNKLTKLAAAALAEYRAGKTMRPALDQRLTVAEKAITSGKGISWRKLSIANRGEIY